MKKRRIWGLPKELSLAGGSFITVLISTVGLLGLLGLSQGQSSQLFNTCRRCGEIPHFLLRRKRSVINGSKAITISLPKHNNKTLTLQMNFFVKLNKKKESGKEKRRWMPSKKLKLNIDISEQPPLDLIPRTSKDDYNSEEDREQVHGKPRPFGQQYGPMGMLGDYYDLNSFEYEYTTFNYDIYDEPTTQSTTAHQGEEDSESEGEDENEDSEETEEDEHEHKHKIKKDELSVQRNIPWQYFIHDNKTAHFCPAVAVNAKYLLMAQSCVKKFKTRRASNLFAQKLYPSSAALPLANQTGGDVTLIQLKRLRHNRQYRNRRSRRSRGTSLIKNNLSLGLVSGDAMLDDGGERAPICLPSMTGRKQNMVGRVYFQYFWPQFSGVNSSSSSLSLSSSSSLAAAAAAPPFLERTEVVAPHFHPECKEIVPVTNRNSSNQICAMPILDYSKCRNALSGGYLTVYNAVTSRQILMGFYSYGSTNCDDVKPAVFTRIDQYLKWIVPTIQEGECSRLKKNNETKVKSGTLS